MVALSGCAPDRLDLAELERVHQPGLAAMPVSRMSNPASPMSSDAARSRASFESNESNSVPVPAFNWRAGRGPRNSITRSRTRTPVAVCPHRR